MAIEPDQYDSEPAEVVAVSLARNEANDRIIALTLRYPDLHTEEIFLTLDNAHRTRTDIGEFLSAINYRPQVVQDAPPLSKMMRKRKEQS